MKSVKLDGIAETRDLNPRMRMTQQMTHLLVSVCPPHGQNDSHTAHMSHGTITLIIWHLGEARTASCLKAAFALTYYFGTRHSERKQFCSRWKNWKMGITPGPRDINFGKTQAMGICQQFSAFWKGSDSCQFFSHPLGMFCLQLSVHKPV